MNFKNLIDRFLHLASVPTCVCCKERLDFKDLAFCPECSAEFEEIKTRNCSKCSKILSECSCTTDFMRAHYVKKSVKCFRYNARVERNSANALIYSLKRDNRADVLEKCTQELAVAIGNSFEIDDSFVFTNVPRRKRSIVEQGFDHSELLAKNLAKKFGVPYMRLLKSKAKADQKKLTRDERLRNADFRLISDESLEGKNVIIVDDIITTAASVSAAATLVRALKPKNIYAASLGIAYKDDST